MQNQDWHGFPFSETLRHYLDRALWKLRLRSVTDDFKVLVPLGNSHHEDVDEWLSKVSKRKYRFLHFSAPSLSAISRQILKAIGYALFNSEPLPKLGVRPR